MNELSLRDWKRKMKTAGKLFSVGGLLNEWGLLKMEKLRTARMLYTQKRSVLGDAQRIPTIPQSEAWAAEYDLPQLMARSDFQWRNNGIYAGLLTRAVDNIVGPGSIVVPMTGDTETNAALREAWEAEYADDSFTVNGLSGTASQRVGMLDCFRGGNSLWYLSDGGWQMFEPAQMGTPWGYSMDLRKISGGVEVGADGRPARYWVGPWTEWGYVDARKAFGLRADRCHLMGLREYVSSFRSVPPLAQSVERFVHLDGYLEAELYGARMASSVVGVVTSDDEQVANAFRSALATAKAGDRKVAPLTERVNLAPGAIVSLRGNETFSMEHALRPGTQFSEYVRTMFRICGMKIGMPLEVGLLDFSTTNFSAAKMLMLQARVAWTKYQTELLEPLVARQYREWFARQTAVRVRRSVKTPDRFRVKHHTPPWVDYLKEAMGRAVSLESATTSATMVAREMGVVIEDVMSDRAGELRSAMLAATAAGFDEGSEPWKAAVAHCLGNYGEYRQDLIRAGFLAGAE